MSGKISRSSGARPTPISLMTSGGLSVMPMSLKRSLPLVLGSLRPPMAVMADLKVEVEVEVEVMPWARLMTPLASRTRLKPGAPAAQPGPRDDYVE
jgi:hypothetical protein